MTWVEIGLSACVAYLMVRQWWDKHAADSMFAGQIIHIMEHEARVRRLESAVIPKVNADKESEWIRRSVKSLLDEQRKVYSAKTFQGRKVFAIGRGGKPE